ncbi:MAG TPA: hypothetical protein DCM54_08110 [Gammaproteobacteria bacterium]|nr:hypothetical protein [Gammaproteobacteria bacterium]
MLIPESGPPIGNQNPERPVWIVIVEGLSVLVYGIILTAPTAQRFCITCGWMNCFFDDLLARFANE